VYRFRLRRRQARRAFARERARSWPMVLAGAALLQHADEEAQTALQAVREACLEAVAAGVRTADLGGHASTSEFTDEVIARTRAKLEVWATL
jgi:isocitrate dehydrogenase (NAD+)